MPHLIKGGKYVYSWLRVGQNGAVQLLEEAVRDYGLEPKSPLIISGSRTSGGFSNTGEKLLREPCPAEPGRLRIPQPLRHIIRRADNLVGAFFLADVETKRLSPGT